MKTSTKPLVPSFLPHRESAEHRVEILHLEDDPAKKDVPAEEAAFIVEGGRLARR